MRLYHLRNMVLVILTLVLATLSWPAFAALEDEQDRCHNGGTIINYRVPQTDDIFPAGRSVVGMLASGAALVWLFISTRRRSAKS